MTDSLSIAVHAFAGRVLISFLVDETLLPKQMNLSTSLREPPFCVEISPLWLSVKLRVKMKVYMTNMEKYAQIPTRWHNG